MRVHGEWLLTPERAAVHQPTRTAVIADLHLGYELSRRRGGEAVPLTGLDEVFAPLQALALRRGVKRLVIAGDLFERDAQPAVLAEFLAGLEQLDLELLAVVPGNHDRRTLDPEGSLKLAPRGVSLGAWWVHHGDLPSRAARQVTGHLHPCLNWADKRFAPCFLVRERRIILPAFSADARGANVLRMRRWRDYRCGVIADDRVLDFGMLSAVAARLAFPARQRNRA